MSVEATHEQQAHGERWVGRLVSPSDLSEAAGQLHRYTLTDLAWLAHEAEQHNDDLSMMAVSDEVHWRHEGRRFAELYRSIWPEHARARGYHPANVKDEPRPDCARSNRNRSYYDH